jgi:hypothetical protein
MQGAGTPKEGHPKILITLTEPHYDLKCHRLVEVEICSALYADHAT